MREPNLLTKILVVAVFAISSWGCGKANDAAPSFNSLGKHPATWVSSHGPLYLANPKQCSECHGIDLTGGIAKVSCFSGNVGSQICHTNGPHPVPWPAHNAAPNQANACAPCHGANLTGGSNAPACAQCHTLLVPGVVPVIGTCITCHNKPPHGGVFPNISGAHSKHNALASITGLCDPCHSGGGTGSASHGNHLVVAFASAYNAKAGLATQNTDTSCSNISCHGGVKTPGWRTGRINSDSNCDQCHIAGTAFQTPQYNSYYSGEHNKHLTDVGLVCTDCHDMTVTSNGATHFSGLATPAVFELSPQSTIRVAVSYTKSGATGSCTPGQLPPVGAFTIGICHSQRSW